MHFANCKWIPQQAKNIIVAESATLLFFFDLLCCFEFHGQIAKTHYRSKTCRKLLEKQKTLRSLLQSLWNPQQILRNPGFMCFVNLRCLWIRSGKWNPHPSNGLVLWSHVHLDPIQKIQDTLLKWKHNIISTFWTITLGHFCSFMFWASLF